MEVLYHLFKPPYDRHIRRINAMCGWGWGKTQILIDCAQALLDCAPNSNGLFLEPDPNLLEVRFLRDWINVVPPHLYEFDKGNNLIIWRKNGNILKYWHRWVLGSPQATLDRLQGYNFSWYLDDEAATRCSMDLHRSLEARIREPGAPIYARVTSSTPKMGEYVELVNLPRSITIHGKSEDNPYVDRERFEDMREMLGPRQARRDMDAELVALEDQLWPDVDLTHSCPQGNVDHSHSRFNTSIPWMPFCDMGSATGAFAVVQRIEHGLAYNQPRWVIVAELCPSSSANIRDAFSRLKNAFGTPQVVVAGRDFNKSSDVDGTTPAYFTSKLWGRVSIHVSDESQASKHVQYDHLSDLFCAPNGQRRLTIAKDLVDRKPSALLDDRSKRGVVEMIQQDIWPPEDERRSGEYLPKGPKIRVSHIRDALLMGAHTAIEVPTWTKGIQ